MDRFLFRSGILRFRRATHAALVLVMLIGIAAGVDEVARWLNLVLLAFLALGWFTQTKMDQVTDSWLVGAGCWGFFVYSGVSLPDVFDHERSDYYYLYHLAVAFMFLLMLSSEAVLHSMDRRRL